MTIGEPLLKRIEHSTGRHHVEMWQKALEPLGFNYYERQALSGFLEEMEHLLDARDAVDEVRATMDLNPDSGRQVPNSQQQRALYGKTKAFFNTYYGTLSHLSSVTARFSRIFGIAPFNDNGPFVKWIGRTCANVGHGGQGELERARVFRALLNHPQQFPVQNWNTQTRPNYEGVHIVIYGPPSRSGKIPPGTTLNGMLPAAKGAWQMDAPDEVSVTNSLSNAAMDCLAEIIKARTPGSAFRDNEANHKAVLYQLRGDKPF